MVEQINNPAELASSQVFRELLGTKPFHAPEVVPDTLTASITQAGEALLSRQDLSGFWRFDLEADTTIPAEYILLQHFMGEVDLQREQRMVAYIKTKQLKTGGFPLYEGGPGNISATVKAYFAFKMAGESPDAPYMVKAREFVRNHGGAEKVNVFTRICLATFGQIPWRTVPAMPIEIMLLPRWWIFNLAKVSYWSRCVIVPLLILFNKRYVHKIEPERGVEELFVSPPQSLNHLDKFSSGNFVRNGFLAIDRVLKLVDPLMPGPIRRYALGKATEWMREHMQGEGGIGAIYPAMANAVMALKILDCPPDDPDFVRGMRAIEDLVLEDEEQSYCQPCVSPIWDTCLSVNALSEAGLGSDDPKLASAVQWLFDKQIFVRGDWSDRTPGLASGGWAFQFENDFYPDVDDTSMVLMSLLRAGAHRKPHYRKRIDQAVTWVLGMQNPDGSWGAFDIGNNYEYLNNIPFADHGALVDPGTSDLTARCIEVFAMLGYSPTYPPVARALEWLRSEQETHGGWYGRWGVNYLYGTWSVLEALGAIGEDPRSAYIRKAVKWTEESQNADGGWGESCNSYDDPDLAAHGVSTASQTAWALLGLLAVGEQDSAAVERGIHYLLRTRNAEGTWDEEEFTGTGFPRVFYLRYHGYCHYFPLWALGVYRRQKAGLPTVQQLTREENLSPDPSLKAG